MTKSSINKLQYQVIGAIIEVHKALGPGLLESVYQKCLKYELLEMGFKVQSEFYVPVHYKEVNLNTDLKCDLLINDQIVLELKSVDGLIPVHEAQILTYMKLLSVPKGVLVNFNCANITQGGYKTFVNEYFAGLPE